MCTQSVQLKLSVTSRYLTQSEWCVATKADNGSHSYWDNTCIWVVLGFLLQLVDFHCDTAMCVFLIAVFAPLSYHSSTYLFSLQQETHKVSFLEHRTRTWVHLCWNAACLSWQISPRCILHQLLTWRVQKQRHLRNWGKYEMLFTKLRYIASCCNLADKLLCLEWGCSLRSDALLVEALDQSWCFNPENQLTQSCHQNVRQNSMWTARLLRRLFHLGVRGVTTLRRWIWVFLHLERLFHFVCTWQRSSKCTWFVRPFWTDFSQVFHEYDWSPRWRI